MQKCNRHLKRFKRAFLSAKRVVEFSSCYKVLFENEGNIARNKNSFIPGYASNVRENAAGGSSM